MQRLGENKAAGGEMLGEFINPPDAALRGQRRDGLRLWGAGSWLRGSGQPTEPLMPLRGWILGWGPGEGWWDLT